MTERKIRIMLCPRCRRHIVEQGWVRDESFDIFISCEVCGGSMRLYLAPPEVVDNLPEVKLDNGGLPDWIKRLHLTLSDPGTSILSDFLRGKITYEEIGWTAKKEIRRDKK